MRRKSERDRKADRFFELLAGGEKKLSIVDDERNISRFACTRARRKEFALPIARFGNAISIGYPSICPSICGDLNMPHFYAPRTVQKENKKKNFGTV